MSKLLISHHRHEKTGKQYISSAIITTEYKGVKVDIVLSDRGVSVELNGIPDPRFFDRSTTLIQVLYYLIEKMG